MNRIDRPSVLYIEDDPGLARVVQKMLTRQGYAVEIAGDGRRGLARLRSHAYDVLLVDYRLPGLTGLEVLEALVADKSAPPAIMLSGVEDLSVAVKAMKLGASDFVLKDAGSAYLDLLPPAIARIIETARLVRAKEVAEKALRESEALKTTILDSAIEGIVTVDDGGRVVDFNPAACEMFGFRIEDVRGRDVSELIVPSYLRSNHRRGFQRYLETGDAKILGKRLELTAMRASGEEFPVELAVSAIALDDRRFFTAFIRDITTRRRNEEELRTTRHDLELRVQERTRDLSDEIEERKRAQKNLYDQRQLVELLHRVAVTANAATGIREAMQAGLDDLCAYTGCPVGHVFFRTVDGPVRLVPSDIWHLRDPKRFAVLKEVAGCAEFEPGIGLPGRVLVSGQPALIVDVAEDPDSPGARLTKKTGVKSAFALPVLVGDEVVAVMEFFSDRATGPDEALFRVLVHIGTQLGRVVERHRAEERLRKLSRAVEQSGGVVMITDPAGTIEYVNPKFSEITSYASEEVVGRKPNMLKSGEAGPDVYAGLWRTIKAGQEWRGEFHNRRKDGSLYWVAATISPVKSPDGTITHFVAIEDDITQQKRAAGDLMRAKETAELANRAKTEFLANMSHELRTPLNSIIGFSEMLVAETFGPLGRPEYEGYAKYINESGLHLLDLINDILDVSRIETDALTLSEQRIDVIHVMEVCRNLIQERARAARLTLEIEVPQDPPGLMGDERRVKQILLNLLSNAVKFTPEEGRLRFTAVLDEDRAFVFTVTDTGIGIRKEDMDVVMSPFGQVDSTLARKYEGAGLGLPLSKKLAELHGGTLGLESSPGAGTKVTVRFPPARTVE